MQFNQLAILFRFTVLSFLQPSKAQLPIDVKFVALISITARFEQPLNAELPMLVRELGRVRVVIPEQPENAEPPMLVRELGRVRVVIPEQPENAELPMLVTLLGMETETISLAW